MRGRNKNDAVQIILIVIIGLRLLSLYSDYRRSNGAIDCIRMSSTLYEKKRLNLLSVLCEKCIIFHDQKFLKNFLEIIMSSLRVLSVRSLKTEGFFLCESIDFPELNFKKKCGRVSANKNTFLIE